MKKRNTTCSESREKQNDFSSLTYKEENTNDDLGIVKSVNESSNCTESSQIKSYFVFVIFQYLRISIKC